MKQVTDPMKSFIVTIRKKDDKREHRKHVSATSIADAAVVAESGINNLYTIIRIEVLE